jgi:hypothetical chaperone protein
MAVLGIDFGTSNSGAAIAADGVARLLPLEPGKDMLPTAIFLDYAARGTHMGSAAGAAMIEGREGRFMRALKSVLGTPLAREKRQFMNRRVSLLEIVAGFLGEVRERAARATGGDHRRAIAGRPVHFHSADAGRDAQAATDLAECYRMAGFDEVQFLNEPEAAAWAAGPAPGLSLVVDIGGGTSDFTLFETGAGSVRIVASHGIRLGGTDFDRLVSLARVMPLLGLGGELRNEIGPGRHDVPRAVYQDLASWEKIAFLYVPATLREVKLMARLACDARPMSRLARVIEEETGHDIAFAVEAAKIAANGGGAASINLTPVEPGLRPMLTMGDLYEICGASAVRIGQAASETLVRAGVRPQAVGRVILVGGSSLLLAVDQAVRAAVPGAAVERSDVFTAVVRGLALAGAAA